MRYCRSLSGLPTGGRKPAALAEPTTESQAVPFKRSFNGTQKSQPESPDAEPDKRMRNAAGAGTQFQNRPTGSDGAVDDIRFAVVAQERVKFYRRTVTRYHDANYASVTTRPST
jgi:hypothetical protein